MKTIKPATTNSLEETQLSIRQRILEKAFSRFGRYGFGKTTMAEIAKDCAMSPGNLYRYFKSKKDIGADCAKQAMSQKLELVRKIIDNENFSSIQKLHASTLEVLNYMHFQFSDQAELMELVDFISRERWDIVQEYMKQERFLISEILSQGNSSRDFNIRDVQETSKWIQAALMKFFAPRSMDAFTLEELRKEAEGVVNTLIRGLK